MILCGFCHSAEEAPAVFYVDAGFQGERPTGESWLSAYSSLQDAIDRAIESGGGEVWVKAGIYKLHERNRNASFRLRSGVAVYGGFRGSENRRDQRNAKAHRTILSGDIGTIGIDSDNSYHVLIGSSDTTLDGFIISGGNANGMDKDSSGAGILIPSGTTRFNIANCTFEKNIASWNGGAIFVDGAQVNLTNCTFYSNGANGGSGIATRGTAKLMVMGSLFSSNHAQNRGGAVHIDSEAVASLERSTFLHNSAQGDGGAISATTKSAFDLSLNIQQCDFIGNRAQRNAGALFFEGEFAPVVSQCQFERNTCLQGAGAIANKAGVVAVITSCVFNKNRGIKGSENIQNDDTSKVVDDMESVAALPKPEIEEEPRPKRSIPEVPIYDDQNNEHILNELIGAKAFTVLALGELTDREFIENYRHIEAIARDYSTLNVQCFYIYRFLKHPENNRYLQPFNQQERARQLQIAKNMLRTETTWLYDTMDNQAAHVLSPDNNKSVFVFSKTGEELFAGNITDPAALRAALKNIAGEPEAESSYSRFPEPTLEPLNLMKPKLLDRVHFNPDKETFSPMVITPMDSQAPYYAKLRAEANDELLRSGSGKIYLGFHLDPLYSMQWSNESDPLKFELRTQAGAISPSIKSAPIITQQATDEEPREFVLSAKQLDADKPLVLRVTYAVYAPALKRTIDLRQQYIIQLKKDPYGGEAFRRQIAFTDAPRIKSTPSTAIPFALRQYDANGDGKLTRSEVNGNLWTKFPDIDTNRDGYINTEEYADYLRRK